MASTTDLLRSLLDAGPVLLSGACGTELTRRGVPTPLPLWSASALDEHPEVVAEIHREHVRAGARLITANTFRTDRRTLAAAGLPDRSEQLTRRAVDIARAAVLVARVDHPVLVAGSIAPIADCYEPELAPEDAVLRLEHALRVRNLLRAGADLALVETMNSIREARAALGACRAGALPALVSFVCGPGGRLLSGEPLRKAAHAVAPLAPEAILVNCCSPQDASEALLALRDATLVPYGVYANGTGVPDAEHGWRFEGGSSLPEYLEQARHWLDLGARLIGGCCGTTPAWTAALRKLLDER